MNEIIVTGFQPFDRFPINPSWQVAQRLKLENPEITIKELPVDYFAAHDQLTELLRDHRCDTLLMMGLADCGVLRLETLARKPPQFINMDGAQVLSGHWNFQKNLEELNNRNYTTVLSYDAGSYVCESTYWSGLKFRMNRGYPKNVAFLHVPLFDDKWTIEDLTQAAWQSLKSVATSSPVA